MQKTHQKYSVWRNRVNRRTEFANTWWIVESNRIHTDAPKTGFKLQNSFLTNKEWWTAARYLQKSSSALQTLIRNFRKWDTWGAEAAGLRIVTVVWGRKKPTRKETALLPDTQASLLSRGRKNKTDDLEKEATSWHSIPSFQQTSAKIIQMNVAMKLP